MFTPRRAASALVAGSLAAAMGLSGCGGSGSSPHTLPPITNRPTVSVGTSPSASPSGSKKAELAAATAVVRRYYALANHLRVRMDAKGLARLFTSQCTCNEQVSAVRTAAKKDEHYIDHVRINRLVPALNGPHTAQVLVDFNASKGGLVTSSGRQVTSGPAHKHVRRVFRLVRVHHRWLINQIEQLS